MYQPLAQDHGWSLEDLMDIGRQLFRSLDYERLSKKTTCHVWSDNPACSDCALMLGSPREQDQCFTAEQSSTPSTTNFGKMRHYALLCHHGFIEFKSLAELCFLIL